MPRRDRYPRIGLTLDHGVVLNCPFCGKWRHNLRALRAHVRFAHPAEEWHG